MLNKLLFILIFFPGSIINCFSQDDLDLQKMMPSEIDSSQIFYSKDYYTWCSSVIKDDDGKFHMFYSRWPHGKHALDDDSLNYIFDGFQGWLKYSEIAYAVADKAEGPYRYVKTILSGSRDAKRWDRFTMHNPQIRKFGDFYYLYYISNSFDSAFAVANSDRNTKEWNHWLKYNCTQKIGVLKARTITDLVNGKYERSQQPIMEADGVHTFEVTTNPSVTQGPDGKYYMMYKSRKPNVGNMTLWMARSDTPDGMFKEVAEVFTTPEMACEDPCLWYDKQRKRFYALVKYYSNSGVLAPQFGALALITSVDGMLWTKAAHSLVSLKQLQFKGQRRIDLAHLERPFLLTGKNGQPQAIFAAASINEPGKVKTAKVDFASNTFNVCFKLKNN